MRQVMFFTILITVFSTPTFLVNAADIEDGLWMYLPLNEGTGETVTDHGPHAFDTELSKSAPKSVDAKHNDIGKRWSLMARQPTLRLTCQVREKI